jgi:hypothetical protein
MAYSGPLLAPHVEDHGALDLGSRRDHLLDSVGSTIDDLLGTTQASTDALEEEDTVRLGCLRVAILIEGHTEDEPEAHHNSVEHGDELQDDQQDAGRVLGDCFHDRTLTTKQSLSFDIIRSVDEAVGMFRNEVL